MTYGVIDIGTNTVRSVIYDNKLNAVAETVAESTILKHTENGSLTERGVNELCAVLNKAVSFFSENSTDIINAFATSAMRDVKNYKSVKAAVQKACKITIELLSEKEEALCDFESVKLQTENNISGAAADLGGGSCQLLLYKNGDLLYHCSKKIGVKRMYNMFGELTREKENAVRSYIKDSLGGVPFFETEVCIIMGGTSKKIKKLSKAILGSPDITGEALSSCLELYYGKNPAYTVLSSTEVNKIPYGIIILDELCSLCGAKKTEVLGGGVREGYVLRHISANQK